MNQYPPLMVGVSTAQNTVNVIPATQMRARQFIFVETAHAFQNKWAINAAIVLEAKCISVLDSIIITSELNADIVHIKNSILLRTEKQPSVAFNFGGGQKAQATAIWEAFRQRKNPNDLACYIDQTTGKIYSWAFENDELIASQITIDSKLSITDVFQIYGFKIDAPGVPFYVKGRQLANETHFNYLNFQEFRQYMMACFKASKDRTDEKYTLAEIKTRFDAKVAKPILKAKIEESLNGLNFQPRFSMPINQYEGQFYETILKKIREDILKANFTASNDFTFSDGMLLQKIGNKRSVSTKDLSEILQSNIGPYFEKILVQKTKSILDTNDHEVIEAIANLKISKGDDKGEYDIVFVTTKGQIVVLDAKTDEFDKKDEDARKLNLLNAGGFYANFYPVYLLYPDDLAEPWANQTILSKIKDATLNNKKYLTFNIAVENKEVVVLNQKCMLNPIHQLKTILKL